MKRRLLAVLLSILAAAACQQQIPSSDVIAEVGRRQYVYDDFKNYLDQSTVDPEAILDSEVLSMLLDQMLNERLLWQLAADASPEGRGLSHRDAVERLLAETAGPTVTEAEAAQYYRLHREEFELSARVVLRQILLDDPVAAGDLRQLWAWGASFDEIAERVDAIPGAFIGQDGEFTRAELPGSFAELLFAMDAGTVSDVLTTDYGYHIIQVIDHLPETTTDFSSVKEEIRRRLEEERIQNEVDKLVESARERYNVRVFVRNVPFNYEGSYEPHIYQSSE